MQRNRRAAERGDLIVAVAAVGHVGALRRDPIVAGAAVDQVGAGPGEDQVVPVAAEEERVAGAPVQRVIAAPPSR